VLVVDVLVVYVFTTAGSRVLRSGVRVNPASSTILHLLVLGLPYATASTMSNTVRVTGESTSSENGGFQARVSQFLLNERNISSLWIRRNHRGLCKGALCAYVIRLRVSYTQNDETRSRNSLR